MQKKHGLANAEKTCLGQCRKNNKTKGGGASRRPLGDYYFLHWPRHVFWALAHPYFLGFGPCLFFGLWPMLIFWALAPAYFFRYFFWLWPGPAPATFKGFPVHEAFENVDFRATATRFVDFFVFFLFFQQKKVAEKISMGQSPKNKHGPKP